MPIADNDPHPLTKRTAESPYGCYNGDRSAPFYWAPIRQYYPDGSFSIMCKKVVNSMSRECRYDRSLTDPRCIGCIHQGSGEAYSTRIEKEASL